MFNVTKERNFVKIAAHKCKDMFVYIGKDFLWEVFNEENISGKVLGVPGSPHIQLLRVLMSCRFAMCGFAIVILTYAGSPYEPIAIQAVLLYDDNPT